MLAGQRPRSEDGGARVTARRAVPSVAPWWLRHGGTWADCRAVCPAEHQPLGGCAHPGLLLAEVTGVSFPGITGPSTVTAKSGTGFPLSAGARFVSPLAAESDPRLAPELGGGNVQIVPLAP